MDYPYSRLKALIPDLDNSSIEAYVQQVVFDIANQGYFKIDMCRTLKHGINCIDKPDGCMNVLAVLDVFVYDEDSRPKSIMNNIRVLEKDIDDFIHIHFENPTNKDEEVEVNISIQYLPNFSDIQETSDILEVIIAGVKFYHSDKFKSPNDSQMNNYDFMRYYQVKEKLFAHNTNIAYKNDDWRIKEWV